MKMIRIPVYMGRVLEGYDYDFLQGKPTWPGTLYLDIDATPRELAKAGIDYEEFNWKSIEQIKEEQKTRITPKTISKATSGLPIRAINHVKELFSKRKDNQNNER